MVRFNFGGFRYSICVWGYQQWKDSYNACKLVTQFLHASPSYIFQYVSGKQQKILCCTSLRLHSSNIDLHWRFLRLRIHKTHLTEFLLDSNNSFIPSKTRYQSHSFYLLAQVIRFCNNLYERQLPDHVLYLLQTTAYVARSKCDVAFNPTSLQILLGSDNIQMDFQGCTFCTCPSFSCGSFKMDCLRIHFYMIEYSEFAIYTVHLMLYKMPYFCMIIILKREGLLI